MLIYNPAAGGQLRLRRRGVEEVAAAKRRYGGDPEPLPSREPQDGFVRGEEAGRRFSIVAVLGGDGTVNEVLNGVVAAGGTARLLVLPGGSVNVLARDLRIPLDPCRAAALLRKGVGRRLYLGRAGKRYFALMAGGLPRIRDFLYFNATRLRISSDRPAYVQVDGEPHDPLPMEFSSDSTALRFLVPP